MPLRLRAFFVGVPIYFAFCALMILFFGNVALMLFLVAVCRGAVALLLLYNVVVLIGMRRPMITLSESYLIYRTLRIPWQLIRGVTTVHTPMGDRVGIALGSDVIRVKRTEPGEIPLPGGGYLLRKASHNMALSQSLPSKA